MGESFVGVMTGTGRKMEVSLSRLMPGGGSNFDEEFNNDGGRGGAEDVDDDVAVEICSGSESRFE